MAEGFTRHIHGDSIDAFSAGVVKKGVDPLAVLVMRELGIDISTQRSKRIEELGEMEFTHVITLCSHALESCPVYPSRVNTIHMGFDDPPILAAESSKAEDIMWHYRRVRDEIGEFIRTLPTVLGNGHPAPEANADPSHRDDPLTQKGP